MTDLSKPTAPDWFSYVQPIETIVSAENFAWDESADLVVVGYGGAGAAAAVEAARRGLSVIAVDSNAGGGSTAMNGGIVYLGGGTPIQHEAGFDDDAEEMYKYLALETQGVVSERTLRRFCDTSVETFEWLVDCGVRFNSTYYPGKTSYPWKDFYLYHPDNSLAPAFSRVAKPAPRGHKGHLDLGPRASSGFGVALYNPLRDTARRLGVTFHPYAQARRLFRDADGRVVGVEVLQVPQDAPGADALRRHLALAKKWQLMLAPQMPGAAITIGLGVRHARKAAEIESRIAVRRTIRARRALCLSAGGFVQNRPMVEHYAPRYSAGMPNGSPGDDGSGIRLGQTAGGAVTRMSTVSSWRTLTPPSAWTGGIFVNARGARYVNEELYGAAIGHAMVEEQGGIGWLILDAPLWQRVWSQIRHDKLLSFQRDPAILAMLFAKKKAPTIERLAAKFGADPATLRASVDANNHAAAGAPDPFDKSPDETRAILQPPFYAINMSITSRLFPLATITMGGLVVDEDSGQVLRSDGSPIEGLYAAGRTAVGICSNMYVSGLSAADCIFSGRRAAAHVAERAGNGPPEEAGDPVPLRTTQDR